MQHYLILKKIYSILDYKCGIMARQILIKDASECSKTTSFIKKLCLEQKREILVNECSRQPFNLAHRLGHLGGLSHTVTPLVDSF